MSDTADTKGGDREAPDPAADKLDVAKSGGLTDFLARPDGGLLALTVSSLTLVTGLSKLDAFKALFSLNVMIGGLCATLFFAILCTYFTFFGMRATASAAAKHPDAKFDSQLRLDIEETKPTSWLARFILRLVLFLLPLLLIPNIVVPMIAAPQSPAGKAVGQRHFKALADQIEKDAALAWDDTCERAWSNAKAAAEARTEAAKDKARADAKADEDSKSAIAAAVAAVRPAAVSPPDYCPPDHPPMEHAPAATGPPPTAAQNYQTDSARLVTMKTLVVSKIITLIVLYYLALPILFWVFVPKHADATGRRISAVQELRLIAAFVSLGAFMLGIGLALVHTSAAYVASGIGDPTPAPPQPGAITPSTQIDQIQPIILTQNTTQVQAQAQVQTDSVTGSPNSAGTIATRATLGGSPITQVFPTAPSVNIPDNITLTMKGPAGASPGKGTVTVAGQVTLAPAGPVPIALTAPSSPTNQTITLQGVKGDLTLTTPPQRPQPILHCLVGSLGCNWYTPGQNPTSAKSDPKPAKAAP